LRQFLPAIRPERLRTILNGIDVRAFAAGEPRDLRAELKIGEHQALVGFFGRFMAQKGFRYLVDALEILKRDPTLSRQPVVAAFGAGGFVREEMAEIERRGLRDSV